MMNYSLPSLRVCSGMCNLYSVTKGQAAIRALARAMHDRTGNLPPLPGIFPDYSAPIVRNAAGGRELTMARWGMPSPVFALAGKKSDAGVTNIRNLKSPHWRRWLEPESRCVVPFTSFSEYEVQPDRARVPAWFALDDSRPPRLLRWHLDALDVGQEGSGEPTNDLFGFLTTEPNAEVAPIHPKGMPEEIDIWLNAPTPEALALQKPLPDGALSVVMRGEKEDVVGPGALA
jgi:putative SOS response-associated peptidase YedK